MVSSGSLEKEKDYELRFVPGSYPVSLKFCFVFFGSNLFVCLKRVDGAGPLCFHRNRSFCFSFLSVLLIVVCFTAEVGGSFNITKKEGSNSVAETLDKWLANRIVPTNVKYLSI